MNKNRLEAFTDGVYAIAITLLILDIRIPEVAYNSLGAALLKMLPQLYTYVLSFFVVGLYWIANHRISRNVKQIDGILILLNLVWLLFVSVMPFPTALLGRYPLKAIPIAIYGIDLILANATGFFINLYLQSHPDLCVTPITPKMIRATAPIYALTNGLYVIGIALAWVLPWISYAIFGGVLVWLLVRYTIISNPFQGKPSRGQMTEKL
jgi:uncharacterized membrane protein